MEYKTGGNGSIDTIMKTGNTSIIMTGYPMFIHE